MKVRSKHKYILSILFKAAVLLIAINLLSPISGKIFHVEVVRVTFVVIVSVILLMLINQLGRKKTK